MATDLDSRLDVHELMIQRLQVTLVDIKASLHVVNEACEKQREFQKHVLNWMQLQDSRSKSRSISHLPASSSDTSSDSSLQCVIAKLEEIMSRSEARWTSHGNSDEVRSDRNLMVGSRVAKTPANPFSAPIALVQDGILAYSTAQDVVSAERIVLQPMINVFGAAEELLAHVIAFQQLQKAAVFEKQFTMATVVSMFQIGDRRLGWKGGTLTFLAAFAVGSYHVPPSHSWVVHGQNRPPEDATQETSLGFGLI